MKKKILLLVSLFSICFCLTGCTSYLKDKNKRIIKNETTGQNIVENILCQPTSESTLKIYKDNDINLDKLPTCEKFKINSGSYEGVWNTLFVKPLAWIILKVGYLFKNFGLAIIFITFIIRLILMPFTKKAAMQSENLKLIQPELDKLERKYKDRNDQDSMMQKSQEMMMLYKKYNINPTSGCLFSFIQLPLFLAFYESLYRLPAVFEGKFLTFHLGVTPMTAISTGKYYYLIFVVLVFLVTYYSFKLNAGAAMGKEQEAQMKMMRNITLVIIGTTSFNVSVAIALYWIVNSGFTIVQNLLVKRRPAK